MLTWMSASRGHVIMSTNSREVPNRKISEEEALNKAADFLRKGPGDNGKHFLYGPKQYLGGYFCQCQQNVIIYPDQVKVQVTLDNGQVIGFKLSITT